MRAALSHYDNWLKTEQTGANQGVRSFIEIL